MYEDKLITFFRNISFPELGIGFFVGLFLGFFIKKSIKFFVFLIILLLIFLFIFGYKEYIDLNNAIITNQSDKIVSIVKELFTFLKEIFNIFSFELSSSAILGFFIGFKLG